MWGECVVCLAECAELTWAGHALEAEAVVESAEGFVREAVRVTMAGELAKLSRVWNQIRMGQ